MLRRIAQTVGPLIQERTVNLRRIPQQNDLGTLSRSGDDSLDLSRRHILCLVNHQISPDDRTTADKIHRLCLDQSP